MLAIRSWKRHQATSVGLFLVIVVNARDESRKRLLGLLTHPKVLPWEIQYLFGRGD